MTIQRMDNVGVVVDDLEAAIAFFVELGMDLEARSQSRDLRWTVSSDSKMSEWTSQ
jgi:catechol 2,3-dioxygenase-like lactoylglutathione lyase family enzyme